MSGGRGGGRPCARLAVAVPNSPAIDGWTVTRQGGLFRAVCDGDPSLIVEHHDPERLAAACAAISRPPRRISSVQGPLGGLNA